MLDDVTWQGRWAPAPVALAALPLWTASQLARSHWNRLLRERGQDRDDALDTAGGLPVVTNAGAIGAGAALLLASILWWRGRDRRDPLPRFDSGARRA